MNPRVGGGPNELAHDEWSVGENEQTEETEKEMRELEEKEIERKRH